MISHRTEPIANMCCYAGDVMRVCECAGLSVETALRRRARNERLAVLRCRRSAQHSIVSVISVDSATKTT